MSSLQSIKSLCPGVRAVIGLTGGIGSGKSNARRVLASLGAITVDADKAGHSAYLPGTAPYSAVIEAFGNQIIKPDSTIDRAALGAIVFSNPESLKKLTDIVWPAIIDIVVADINSAMESHHTQPVIAVVEAAVLLEAGWDKRVDTVWTTVVDEATAIQRVMERDSCSEETARKRLAAQAPVEDKIAAASVVIDTSGSFGTTESAIRRHWAEFLAQVQAAK